MVETLDQLYADCPEVNHAELRYYIFITKFLSSKHRVFGSLVTGEFLLCGTGLWADVKFEYCTVYSNT